jgi:hypothetical protein
MMSQLALYVYGPIDAVRPIVVASTFHDASIAGLPVREVFALRCHEEELSDYQSVDV